MKPTFANDQRELVLKPRVAKDFISVKTRLRFREVLVEECTLHSITMIFQGAELSPNSEHQSPPEISGERRRLIERYYANVVWNDRSSIRLVLKAYESTIESLQEARSMLTSPEEHKDNVPPLLKLMEADGFAFLNGHFLPIQPKQSLVPASMLTEISILEHVEKSRGKIENQDFAGAIASSYTLVETFLKQMLGQLNVRFKTDEGDIRTLYQAVADPLALNPKGEHLESYLKQI